MQLANKPQLRNQQANCPKLRKALRLHNNRLKYESGVVSKFRELEKTYYLWFLGVLGGSFQSQLKQRRLMANTSRAIITGLGLRLTSRSRIER